MSVTVLMPETGNLLKWHYAQGDSIKPGDLLCEIETDKTVMEIEAEVEGVLQKILVNEGASAVAAAEPLALIVSHEASRVVPDAAAPAQPAMVTDMPATVPARAEGGRIFSSPLARRLARESGIELSRIAGSGPGGRIVERDVIAATAARPDKPSVAPLSIVAATTLPKPSGTSNLAGMFAAGTYEEIPVDNMRRTIAERLQQSKQTIPHFYLSLDTELDALVALRKQLNDSALRDGVGNPSYQLSINDFIVKGWAMALQQVPAANAVWAGDRILRFKHADVGVAVAIEGGLFTPVIHNADQKTLSVVSNEIKDLAARARKRNLQPSEYQGGATAISNLGMFGIKQFSAIINPPQSSILAVGAGEARMIVRDGAPAIATLMSVTLSCDHRVIDGALGAQLLAAFKALIENPTNLMV
jgi:pyruvate dehydrogenase E2 component (dihydrolipoamide acetyltransferase)